MQIQIQYKEIKTKITYLLQMVCTIRSEICYFRFYLYMLSLNLYIYEMTYFILIYHIHLFLFIYDF